MVQKQREKDSKGIDDIRETVSDTVKGSKSSSSGTLGQLYNTVKQEGNAKSAALSGGNVALLGLFAAGVLPTTILPMFLGIALGGAFLGKMIPKDVYSVIGGVAVSSFLTFLLFVNIPIIGLGLISTIIFTLVSTGAATAAHQYVSDDPI